MVKGDHIIAQPNWVLEMGLESGNKNILESSKINFVLG